jgi:hypothetical protein
MNQAGKRVVPAQMNIYTVLALVATLALGVGVAFVWKISSEHTGQKSPWYVEPKTKDQASVTPPAS